MATVREPAVAGRFYPAEAEGLRAEIERCLGAEPARGAETPATAVILPHAGYVYSGAIAGSALGVCRVPERAIVIGPNHTGDGALCSLHPAGEFRLPGGRVAVDAELTAACAREAALTFDTAAHRHEHSIEVELPLLAAKNPELRIAALCLSWLDFAACQALGESLARAVTASGGSDRVLLVASTDMSHYIGAERARELDTLAIERVLALDAEGLHRTVVEQRISMCGVIPTTVVLVAARALGARRAELVRYGNSGDVSGDWRRVVGYAGMVVR